MTVDKAIAVLGWCRPQWELRNMVRALEFMAWQNTAEEKTRLQAARFALRNFRAYAAAERPRR